MPTFPRKGMPLTISLDPDAMSLLRAMVPNNKGLGLLLSELLRKEAREREGRSALLERLRLQHGRTQALAESAP
jgi:hypothetical protein